MISRNHVALFVAVVVLIGPSRARAEEGVMSPRYPQFQVIDDAARIADPAAREAALREAIKKGLLDSPPAEAAEVLGYIGSLGRWIDLRPFEDIISEFGRVNNPANRDVGAGLDTMELARMSREERLRIYSEAIVNGSVTLRHGYQLIRAVAMGMAAIEGLTELRPLIEAHYSEVSPYLQRTASLRELRIRLELSAGAADREDAARRASERLAVMTDSEFRDRMDHDSAFRTVVEKIAPFACAVGPVAPYRNPGCASIKDIVRRQLRLEKTMEESSRGATATSVSPGQADEGRMGSWLTVMKDASAGEPSIRQRH